MVARILSPAEASAIQTALNEVAHAQLMVDGHFGALSQQAVMRFQADHNISPADGNPSQPTLDALGIPNLFAPPVRPHLTPNPIVQAIGAYALQAIINRFIPKGPFPMLTNFDKAWVAGVVAFACQYIINHFFGITVGADTQSIIVTVIVALVTGVSTWIVPNKAKA